MSLTGSLSPVPFRSAPPVRWTSWNDAPFCISHISSLQEVLVLSVVCWKIFVGLDYTYSTVRAIRNVTTFDLILYVENIQQVVNDFKVCM